jgi:hypothetical protein
MRQTRLATFASAAMIGVLAACSGGSGGAATATQAGATGSAPDTGAVATSAAAASTAATPEATTEATTGGGGGAGGPSVADIKVTLTGGPDAGTYEAHPTEVSCSYGLAGDPDSWGNQYSTSDKSVKFSSLQLIVPSTKAAASGTKEVLMTITIGEIFKGHDYEIDTTKGKTGDGTGTATIQTTPDHKTGTVTVKGTTKDNVGIDATIQCNQVFTGS